MTIHKHNDALLLFGTALVILTLVMDMFEISLGKMFIDVFVDSLIYEYTEALCLQLRLTCHRVVY